MLEVGRHPNIVVLANSDILAVEGKPGNFQVLLRRRPRYVNEDLCVACRACASYCPYNRLNPFDENLSTAKAIDVLCPQTVPAAAVVDRESCLYFQNKCAICLPVCQAKAIDFKQKRKKALARVGAIILTTGYETFDASRIKQYGYGRMKNVVTSIEFERLLNADGPFHGEVLRYSDRKVPKRIAWLQCVGSRDRRSGHSYCSGVCCTYALKHIILTKNHYPDTRIAIFHNGIRTYGKGFEILYRRAEQLQDVRFIKKRVPAIKENPENHNLILSYFSDTKTVEEEFEMVVLSVGISPGQANEPLSQIFGLELNEHGFFKTDNFYPNGGNGRCGIYPGGTLIGPMDIPDSISSATGAVSLAAQLLAEQRGILAKPKTFPEERSVEREELRIGVFVCHCGTNIAGVANIGALVEHASSLENVVHFEAQLISCAADSCGKILEIIKEKKLNRVVVAACTPRDHAEVFQETLRQGGLNPYLLEMANIREHCTWVHSFEKEEATQKAKDLISMAVAKARNLVPLREVELPVNPKCLVLGGGLGGMKAALSVAGQGFEVYLVEKEQELGGNLRHLHYTIEGKAIEPFLQELIQEVKNKGNIKVYQGYELKSFSGHVGNYRSIIKVSTDGGRRDGQWDEPIELDHGTVILATGGKPLVPTEYSYGKSGKVLIQQEFENMLASQPKAKLLLRVAMIQCVGARNKERPYCSRICCETALKNALKLKELNPETDITVFYRDLRAYGFLEDYYTKSREAGISFIRYSTDKPPRVDISGEDVQLSFHDPVLNLKGDMHPDLVVLSTPIVTNGNQELAQLLRVPLTTEGFFMEAHMKLRPLDFNTDGMFLCGLAHYPKNISETISQANGAAARAATILSKKTVVSSGAVAEVREALCSACGLCEKVCPYSAIGLQESTEGKVARVIPVLCKGCGVCASKCPTGAITHNHFTDKQILAQVDTAFSVPLIKEKPKILAFLCHWCGYAGADLAGVSRLQYATNVRDVRVMCSGRIHSKFIYEAFLKGMDAVIVVGCHMEDCHYITGVQHTLMAIPSTQKTLEKIGIEPERLKLEFCSAAEGAKYASVINEFSTIISKLEKLTLNEKQKEKLLKLKEKRQK